MFLAQHGILGASRVVDSIPVPNEVTSRTASIFPFTVGGNDWQGRTNIIANDLGEWVMIWFEGTNHSDRSATTVRVNIAFSDDEGANWSDNNEDLLGNPITGFPLEAEEEPTGALVDFNFFKCPNGDLIIIGQERDPVANGSWNDTNVTCSQYRSTDNGLTWAFEFDFCNAIGFTTATQKTKIQGCYESVIVGNVVYIALNEIDTSIADSRTCLYKSTDNAATWSKVSDITAYAERTYSWTEVSLIYFGGSRLGALGSQNGTNYGTAEYRESYDMGVTWGTVTDITEAIGWTGLMQPRTMILGSNLIVAGRDNKRFPYDIALSYHDRCGFWTTPLNNLWDVDETKRWYLDPFYAGVSTVAVDQGDAGYARYMRRSDNTLVCFGYYGTAGASGIYKYVIEHTDTPSDEVYANNEFFPETLNSEGVRLQCNRDSIGASPSAPVNGGIAIASRIHNNLDGFIFQWTGGGTVANEFVVDANGKGWLQMINGVMFSDTVLPNDLFQTSFSMGFWLKPSDGIPATTNIIFWNNSNTTTTLDDGITISITTTGKMLFRYAVGGTQVTAITNAAVWADGGGQEKHIAWTVTSGGSMKVYVDAVEVALEAGNPGDMSTVTMASFFNASHFLYMGARQNGASTFDLPYVGDIREVLMQTDGTVWNAGNIANIMLN